MTGSDADALETVTHTQAPDDERLGRRPVVRDQWQEADRPVNVLTMASATSTNTVRKKARDRATTLLDAEDAERRRLEAARRKRVTGDVAAIAANDLEIAQAKARIDQLRADTDRRLAAIVADGVSEAAAAEMTERELREVKAAVKAGLTTGRTPSKKAATCDSGADPAPA